MKSKMSIALTVGEKNYWPKNGWDDDETITWDAVQNETLTNYWIEMEFEVPETNSIRTQEKSYTMTIIETNN